MSRGFGSVRELVFTSCHYVDQVTNTPRVPAAQKGLKVLAITRVGYPCLITKPGKIPLQSLVRGFEPLS